LEKFPDAPVISNLDYEGMGKGGWQRVKERHEPMHQLTLRSELVRSNLQRCLRESENGQCLLEPQGDRSRWVRIPYIGDRPSIHVNHSEGRFTSHGEVCYNAVPWATVHPYWGEWERYLEVKS
jgi:hypothetical protein